MKKKSLVIWSAFTVAVVAMLATTLFIYKAQQQKPIDIPFEEIPIWMVALPTISPSGDYLAFNEIRNAKTDLFDINSRSPIQSRIMILSLHDGKTIRTPADPLTSMFSWSPDETSIVYENTKIDGDFEHGPYRSLNHINLDTNAITTLSEKEVSCPKVGPHGKMLGFVSDGELFLQSGLTGNPKRIRGEIKRYTWYWGQDAKCVYYATDQNELCVYDVEENTERLLWEAPSDNFENQINQVAVSPDYTQIAFTYGGWLNTISVQTGEVTKLCACNDRSLKIDWNETGILFNHEAELDVRKTSIVVYSPTDQSTETLVTGHVSDSIWISETEILYRKGEREFWKIDVESKVKTLIYRAK